MSKVGNCNDKHLHMQQYNMSNRLGRKKSVKILKRLKWIFMFSTMLNTMVPFISKFEVV